MRRFRDFFLSEYNMLVAIMINALVICLLYFPEFKHNRWLELIDQLFILIFLIEAIVKLNVYKPKLYFSSNWNLFDFLIVVVSLPSLLMHFISIPDTSLFLLLRLFRLIRVVRFIRFVPNLNKVMEGLGRALKASVFVLIALFFLNFMLAIFTCHFYGEIAPKQFGDPLVASYSIFQLFTVEGWNEMPAIITNKMSGDSAWQKNLFIGFTRFYFVLIVLVGGIFGMSLANAVFVDEMTMDNNRLLEDKIENLQSEILEIKALLQKNIAKESEDLDT